MTVIVYTKPRCRASLATKVALKFRGIDFEEINVSHDAEARAFITNELGHQVLPVVYCDARQHWSGFNIRKIGSMVPHRDPSFS